MDLRVARQIARLTQRELARRAGVDASMISHLETHKRHYRDTAYATIVQIARALHVDPELLFPIDVTKPGAVKPAVAGAPATA